MVQVNYVASSMTALIFFKFLFVYSFISGWLFAHITDVYFFDKNR